MGRGFGFITTGEEKDLVFHRHDLVGVEFKSLKGGQEVEFEKGQESDGRPKAVSVRLAETQADDDGGDDQGGGEDEA